MSGGGRAIAIVSRDALEKHQVWVYLAVLVLGAVLGTAWPQWGQQLDLLVWPALAVLLYATFTQMNLADVPRSLKNIRFLVAAVLGNFLFIPLAVAAILAILPAQDPLILGLLLVLLVPCTDWFITFTGLGRGDAALASVWTPLALFLQLALLPLYLHLLSDIDFDGVFSLAQLWPALLVLAAPLLVAALTEAGARRTPALKSVRQHAGWLPVPCLGLVILLVAASHIHAVQEHLNLLPWVALACALFLAAALVIARLLATALRLRADQGRTLAFSLSTRNSFIVLPIALSMPQGWEITAVVIVIQSVIELLGMIFCLWFIPTVLFPPAQGRDVVPGSR